MKKVLLISLTVLSLFILSGCGKKVDNKKDNKPVEEKEKTTQDENKEENKKEDQKPLETSYEKVLETKEKLDTVGDFSFYIDGGTANDNAYIVNNKTKSIIVSGQFQSVSIPLEFEDNEDVEGTCCIGYPSNCDYYAFNIADKSYFVNKKENIISSKSYDYIGCIFNNDGNALGLCNDDLDVIIVQNIISKGDGYASILGLLNTKTGFEYIEPKFDDLVLLGKDRLAGRINGKVGLYTKEGKEVLKPEYDLIGSFTTNSEKIYFSIKNGEVKIFDENLKSRKINYNDNTIINGVGDEYSTILESVLKLNVSDNDYFKYTGTNFVGEKNIVILKLACGDYDEQSEKYIDSKDSVIFVIENGELKQLDPKLIEQKLDMCGMDF